MKPDQQSNYWRHDQEQEVVQVPQVNSESEVIAEQTSDEQPQGPVQLPDEEPVRWVAEEYVHSDRGGWWYIVFALVAMALIAADVFLLKSWTFSVLVVVMAIALVVYIRRPARQLQYALSGSQGLYIGDRLYHLGEFKSFGLIEDAGRHSIMLIPTKRFAPSVSVYFPEEVGEQVVDILGTRLPMEQLKLDAIDVLIRKLRL